MDDELSPDLAVLGRQLMDDAAWLAARYPAGSIPEIKRHGGRRRGMAWISAAAVLAICGGTWIALGTRPALSPTREPVDRIAVREDLGPSVPITDSVLDVGEAYLVATEGNSTDGMIVPAALFRTLSGPEQEGLLDLLDEMAPEAIDFSM